MRAGNNLNHKRKKYNKNESHDLIPKQTKLNIIGKSHQEREKKRKKQLVELPNCGLPASCRLKERGWFHHSRGDETLTDLKADLCKHEYCTSIHVYRRIWRFSFDKLTIHDKRLMLDFSDGTSLGKGCSNLAMQPRDSKDRERKKKHLRSRTPQAVELWLFKFVLYLTRQTYIDKCKSLVFITRSTIIYERLH